jgi:amino acid transporter
LRGVAGLKKHDMKTASIVFMVYCLVCAGAFGIEEMVPAGPGVTLTLLLIFPVIWAWPISNMMAEAGSLFPSEGGIYVWAKEAFGEFWGFQACWWNTASAYITNSVYTALVVDYVSQYAHMSETVAFTLKILMIAVFTVINLLGIKEVGMVSSALSVLILLAFAVVAAVGFMNWGQNPMTPYVADGMSLMEGVGGTVAICAWMYCGYESISIIAGEVKKPQIIPKALMLCMPLVALSYVLPTLAGLASVGRYEDWATYGGGGSVGYADVLTTYLGEGWGYAFLFIAIISQCAIFNAYLASGSRGFFVLADDHLCPKVLTKVSKKRGVPYVGVLSLALVTALLAKYDFKTLVKTEVIFIMAMYIILPPTILKLREMYPVEGRKGLFVMPGGKAGLYLFTLVPFALAIFIYFMNGTDNFLIGVAAASTGPIVYMALKWVYGGCSRDNPEKYPLNPVTRLNYGDSFRVALFSAILGLASLAGSVFLSWYEGGWGEEYYANEAESAYFSDFWWMIDMLKWVGAALLIAAFVLLMLGVAVERQSAAPAPAKAGKGGD